MKKRLSKKTGLPPGTPVYTGKFAGQTKIRLVRYDEGNFRIFDHITPEKVLEKTGADTVNWFIINGFQNPEIIEKIGAEFQIDPLILEDIFNVEHMPKVEETGGQLFITLKSLTWKPGENMIASEQVSIFLGSNVIITFQEAESDLFDPIIDRLRAGKGRARIRQEDYLAYQLIDRIVDNYYLMLDQAEDQIEEFEEALLKNPSDTLTRSFLSLKKNLVILRRTISPLKEDIRYIIHDETDILTDITRQHLTDVHDHLSQIIQTIDNMREMAATLMDLMMASSANRMNGIMKTLTLVSTIFIPLTFLAGIYGMNFQNMPELSWKYGYPAFLIVVLCIEIGMYIFMKRRKWF